MKRKSYGRDAGLSLRMHFTSFLLGLLYVGFGLVLFYVFNAGLVFMLVIVIGLAVFQYYTSDKIALAASGAKVVSAEEAPQLHARFGLYAGFFGGWGGGNRDNNNSVPVWLIIVAVSIVTYALNWSLIRTISRYREYAADRGSALITGAPEYLMSALQKISSQMTLIPNRDLRQVEGMNAFFIIPARAKGAISELFMDHPPLEKRIAALPDLARDMGRPVA